MEDALVGGQKVPRWGRTPGASKGLATRMPKGDLASADAGTSVNVGVASGAPAGAVQERAHIPQAMPLSEEAYAQSTAVALRSAVVARASHAQVAAVMRNSPQPLRFPLDPERDVVGLGAGDSFLIAHFLTSDEAIAALHALLPDELGGSGEVRWMQMYGKDGRPFARLKSTQADLEQAAVPIYRYPTNNQYACETEAWSRSVSPLKDRVAAVCGQSINHCVGNLYRNDQDFIGPHKDKMLDIMEGSAIASLSLGAARPMVLEHEDGEQKQVVPLRHGSLFIIGPQTNLYWKHSIPQHQIRCGPRVSLTLRHMATFMDMSTGAIHGQGASWTPASGLPRTLAPSRFQDPNWPLWTHDFGIKPSIAFPQRRPLERQVSARHIEGGSSFNCLILPCVDPAHVLQAWQRLRTEHPDACHIPYAWLIRRQRPQPSQTPSTTARRHGGQGSPGGLPLRFRGWNADGEPVVRQKERLGNIGASNTLPVEGEKMIDTAHDGIFRVLQEAHLADCAAFVVRHWDGQRLGLQRLVEAYQTCVRLAMAQLQADDEEDAEHRQQRPTLCASSSSQSVPADAMKPIAQVAQISLAPQQLAGQASASVAKAIEAPVEHSPEYKERRKLAKFLREIEDLEALEAGGKALRSRQKEKVAKKDIFRRRLDELSDAIHASEQTWS